MYEKKRKFRKLGPIIDKINIVLSIGILVSGIILLLDFRKYAFVFPVMFTIAALMNLLLAFKCYKMSELGRAIMLFIAFIGLTILSVIGYMVTL